MNLYLIRHTKVDVQSGICYGQADVGVTATFQSEKEKVKSEISELSFDAIFCSPLKRCKVLAESIIQKEDIVFDERLKELNFGDWELKPWDEIYNSSKGKLWMDNYQTLPTLNGESYPEMVNRISEFYTELLSKKYKNVAIFAHAGVIRIFKSLLEKKSIDELFSTFKPEYGSVTVLRTDGKKD
jgi:alpha-ribazole phosphatase